MERSRSPALSVTQRESAGESAHAARLAASEAPTARSRLGTLARATMGMAPSGPSRDTLGRRDGDAATVHGRPASFPRPRSADSTNLALSISPKGLDTTMSPPP